ncbi:MAG TPA: alpha/beta hydrolase, partial [Alphaproteobacteria bacterium]|nr:alpha/beta hydrolase [Alphaproteobacteria bacterium]
RLYRPEADGPRPLVVFFHGGAWREGDKDMYRFVGEAFAVEGFAVAIPNYRLLPEGRFPVFLEDGAAAVATLRRDGAALGVDPARLFLMGHSAGAYIAAMLALDERYLERRGLGPAALRGAVGVAGPYDFLPFSSDRLREIFAAATPPEQSMPINFVDGTEPPLLLIHSLSDTTVYPKNAQNLAARIRDRGGRVELVEYEKVNHAVLIGAMGWPLRGIAPTLADSTAFLRRVLDPAAAAPADQPAVRSAVSP